MLTKYDVVIAKESSLANAILNLNKKIKVKLTGGWKLQGGVTLAISELRDGTICYILTQAIVQ